MLERVTLRIAGRVLPHGGASLSRSAEEAVRTARFDIVWKGQGLPCQPDEEATVHVAAEGGEAELWLRGYVRDVNWRHDDNDRSYAVSLVSRTIDATETSIDHPTGFVEDCTLEDVATAFDTAGIGVECHVPTDRKPVHQIRPGETLFQTLEADARGAGALILDTPDGQLRITDKPDGRHSGALRHGGNIMTASGTLSGRYAYSEVRVRGQSSFGSSGTALRPEATATGTARRKRPLIRLHEGEATSERLKKRAATEAKRAAGEGNSVTVTVPGWRDEAGKLFEANWLVEIVHPSGEIDQDMVIASLRLDQGAGESEGTTATLTLKDPRALGGENPRGRSAGAWAAPEVPVPTFRGE